MLITCATKDIQVSCADVAPLVASLPPGIAASVTLGGANHVLKLVGASASDGTEYGRDLAFTAELDTPIRDLVARLG